MTRKIFEWSALLTWSVILGGFLTFGTLNYFSNVIDHPQEPRAIEKMPDPFPRTAYRVLP